MSERDLDTGNTVRFGRRPQRGLLLGFSSARVACLALGFASFSSAVFLNGLSGLAVLAPVWLTLISLAFLTWGGRYAVEVAPTVGHFLLRRAAHQTRFRARPSTPRPAGTLALPGDAAALRFHLDETSGAVMVHDPHAHTLTAVAVVRHPAYVLLSPEDQARRVHGWGRALAGLASSNLSRVQILEMALPDSGHGITGWWKERGIKDAGQWAVREYDELVTGCAPAASAHRTLVAVALDLKGASRAIRQSGRGIRGSAAVLRQEMTGFESALRAAELQPGGWLTPTELAGVLRGAYDPDVQRLVDQGAAGQSLAAAGPVAIDEHWDHLRHDTGWSTVLWVSEWPRVAVPTFFLHALVFQPGIRKTLSITVTPLSTQQAMRDIRKAKVEYLTDSAQKARIGAVADLADDRELGDVIEREQALISGHADLRFTGLLAVTAASRDDLESAVAQVERAATQAGCETRRLVGQQARAFASAALPLARKVD